MSVPAFWSAVAASASAAAAWLTYETNFRPNDRIALATTSLSSLNSSNPARAFSFVVLDQGNRGFLLSRVALVEVLGRNLNSDECLSDRLAFIGEVEQDFEKQQAGPQYLAPAGTDHLERTIYPTDDGEARKLESAWVPSHQAVSANVTFATTQITDPRTTAVYCPVVDYVSPGGAPEEAVCPGWDILGAGRADHTLGAGPINPSGYSVIVPKVKRGVNCVVRSRMR